MVVTDLPARSDIATPQARTEAADAARGHLNQALTINPDHAPSHDQLVAERARVEELGGGCTVPVAAHAWHEDGEIRVRSWVAA